MVSCEYYQRQTFMKTLIKILLVFLLVQHRNLIFSQSVLTEGNQWIFEEMEWNLVQGFTDTIIVTITIEEDTLIDGMIYSKVVHSQVPPCWNVRSTEYLRGEGSKIYRRSRDMQHDFLMLDFDDTAGYTMHFDGGYHPLDTAFVIVDSIDTYMTGGGDQLEAQYVRIINNQAYDDETTYVIARDIGFIEGGFLFPQLGNGLCDFQDPIELRCTVIDGDTTHFSQYDCFEITNSIFPVATANFSFQPNPVSDYLQIPDNMRFLDMVGITGQVVQPGIGTNQLDLSDLNPGQYVIRMISLIDNHIVGGRVIKL